MNKKDLLYAKNFYYGERKPENISFNASLQEFTQRVTYTCCLHSAGKLTPQEAYEEIQNAWQQLEHTKEQLKLDR